MIASLRGQVLSNNNGTIVLEVAGVGYLVSTVSSSRAPFIVGQELFLHTALIIREDAHLLFGFETPEELVVFDLLRSVTGVGPKSAQAVLASMSLSEIASAVTSENDSAFKKVVGIGPKTAKLIIVSLAGKLGKPGSVGIHNPQDASKPVAEDRAIVEANSAVVQALLGLGYQEKAITPVVDHVSRELKTTNRNELLRASLASLGTSRSVSGGDDA